MKIEKLNENQIRCTLTRADLAERQLQLSELAYGTEKVRTLFHDMMQQAAFEFGFEAEDIPLMIEAIPASADSIVLIITKVEDPEEIDARFSKFAPLSGTDDAKKQSLLDKLEGAESFLNILEKVKEKIEASEPKNPKDNSSPSESGNKQPPVRLFSFPTLDSVLNAVQLLHNMYSGSSTLYKDSMENVYILALTQSEHTILDFNRICNMLTEYGTLEKANGATLAFLEEHCETMIPNDAVQRLASV